MQDAIAALIVHLKTVSAITDLTSTRIYGGRLLEADVADMPKACVVIRYAGGPVEFRTHRVARPRVDIFSYGDGYTSAGDVDGAVADALIAMSRVEPTGSSTLIHSVGVGQPFQSVEPGKGWPMLIRSAIVVVGETATV